MNIPRGGCAKIGTSSIKTWKRELVTGHVTCMKPLTATICCLMKMTNISKLFSKELRIVESNKKK